MKFAVIAVVVFMQIYELVLAYLNYRNRNAPLADNVRDVFDAETYKKQQAYETEKLKLKAISGMCKTAVFVALLAGNVYSGLYYFIGGYTASEFLRVYFMFSVAWLITWPLDILFNALATFKTEAKYGFNKTTPATFIGDMVKSIIINKVIINLGLLTLFMVLHNAFGNMVFVLFFFVMVLVLALLFLLMPLIARLFSKMTPLEDGSLKDRAIALCEKMGYTKVKIRVTDDSKHSTKAGAGFAGLGRTKTVMLSSNLLEAYSEDEILAIIAHEVGHAKHRHVPIKFGMKFVLFAFVLVMAYFVVNSAVSLSFGFTGLNVAFGMFITMTLFGPISILYGIPDNMVERMCEYQADACEVKYVGREPAISAIKRLYAQNYGNLTPHPIVVKLTHTHPPLSWRVAAMENMV